MQQVWCTRTCSDGVGSVAQRDDLLAHLHLELILRQDDRPTTVTFVNGSQDTMRVEMGRNDTVKVSRLQALGGEFSELHGR